MKKGLSLFVVLTGTIITLILTFVMGDIYVPLSNRIRYFDPALELIFTLSPLLLWILFCIVYDVIIDYFNNKTKRGLN